LWVGMSSVFGTASLKTVKKALKVPQMVSARRQRFV